MSQVRFCDQLACSVGLETGTFAGVELEQFSSVPLNAGGSRDTEMALLVGQQDPDRGSVEQFDAALRHQQRHFAHTQATHFDTGQLHKSSG